MSKKTLTLIVGLIGVTVVLFAVALLSNNASPRPTETAMKPSPTPYAQSTLSMTPNPVVMTASRSASVDVVLDTQGNDATAIQLEIAYDPTILTNFSITPGPLFSTNQIPPDNIISNNDTKNGRITYALVLPLSQEAVQGTGVVARISFTQQAILPRISGIQPTTTELTLLPKSLVTAEGVSKSVLKQATGTVINLYNPNGATSRTPGVTLVPTSTTPVQ